MYAINEGLKKINGELVETYERVATEGDTALRVEAGTTGGIGDVGNDESRSYLCIEGLCGDFHFSEITDEDDNAVGVEIACCGDKGLAVIMKALKFAFQTMKDQRYGVDG